MTEKPAHTDCQQIGKNPDPSPQMDRNLAEYDLHHGIIGGNIEHIGCACGEKVDDGGNGAEEEK